MSEDYQSIETIASNLADEVIELVTENEFEESEAIHETIEGTEYIVYPAKAWKMLEELPYSTVEDGYQEYRELQGDQLPEYYSQIASGMAYAILRMMVQEKVTETQKQNEEQ